TSKPLISGWPSVSIRTASTTRASRTCRGASRSSSPASARLTPSSATPSAGRSTRRRCRSSSTPRTLRGRRRRGALRCLATGSEPEPVRHDDGYTVSEEDAAFAADEALLRGEQLLGEDKYWDAIQVVEGSDVYMFGKRRQKSRLLLARAYMKNPGWRKKSEQL